LEAIQANDPRRTNKQITEHATNKRIQSMRYGKYRKKNLEKRKNKNIITQS